MKNDYIKHKLLQLEDAICEHERGGAPGYTLILIPRDPTEGIHISRDGKPENDLDPVTALDLAIFERGQGGAP